MAWLIVLGDGEAIEWVLSQGRMGFREHVPAERLQPGDGIAIYTTRGAFGNPPRDESQIIGIGEVSSLVRRQSVNVADETYPKSCRLSITAQLPPRKGVPFKPLVESLGFIKNKVAWSAGLRRTLVPLPDRDFKIIERAVRKARATIG
jgi:hypothetical protein